MKIKVSTEALIAAASEASAQISRVSAEFDEIDRTVKNSSSYWEGEGHDAYLGSYSRRIDRIQNALNRFKEHITDLEQIAGVYEETETEVMESTDPLPMDVIV